LDLVKEFELDIGPYEFSHENVDNYCKTFKKGALILNERFRQIFNLGPGLFYENFVLEGKILYLLNNNNELINRSSMFKVKPKDIFKSHFPIFDVGLQIRIFESLDKIYQRGEKINRETMKMEMDISEKGWQRFNIDIMEQIKDLPNPYFQKEGDLHMIILAGLPGSGKSTVAKELEQMGWIRVNQDDLGNRKICEKVTKDNLGRGKSVVIDRCNFDFDQRSTWVRLAAYYNCASIRCLFLNIPKNICKDRVSVRQDHPTIPMGDTGNEIIEKLNMGFIPPMKAEGYLEIFTITSPEELTPIMELISNIKINRDIKEEKSNMEIET